ncbi:hypothetical protein [Marinobacter alexandrii]|uniref:hypothetical protein n=1 Tax=Marinobacter alexandrii TaxID=2570351 RepID=UPI00110823CD|nr:hypothetical protein [Marinobacter alexandrii]
MPAETKRGRPSGTRKTGGRKKGTPNKVTAEIKQIAQSYGEEAIASLVEIMRGGEYPPAARVSASKEILDRAYGKAPQALELSGQGGGPIQTVTKNMTPQEAADAYASTLESDKG